MMMLLYAMCVAMRNDKSFKIALSRIDVLQTMDLYGRLK